VLFLIKKDEQSLVEGFQKNVAKTDWVLQKTKEKETFLLIAKMLSHFGERIEKEADKYGLPVYCMDRDFFEKIDEVKDTRYLLAQGFEVTVIDKEEASVEMAKLVSDNRLHAAVSSFIDYPFPECAFFFSPRKLL
jgi:hypothetical protein